MRYEITLKNYRCFPYDEPAQFTLETGAVTAFLGPNNAGKTAALRFLYECRAIFHTLSDPNSMSAALNGGPQGAPFTGLGDPEAAFTNGNNHGMEIELRAVDDVDSDVDTVAPITRLIVMIDRQTRQMGAHLESVHGEVGAGATFSANGSVTVGARTMGNWARMQTALQSLSNSVYLGPARGIVNLESGDLYYDISIGKRFVAAWDGWKTSEARQQRLAAARVEREVAEILRVPTVDIHAIRDDSILRVKIGDESFRLDELGSGIAQLILVLIHVTISPKQWILVDEPEISLHPAMQVRFLEMLRARAGEGVAIATHSWGLARSVAEHIYSVRTEAPGHSRMARLEREPVLPESLGEMAFGAYREAGYRHVLFVEGRTGAEAVRRWLATLGLDAVVVACPVNVSELLTEKAKAELPELRRLVGDGIGVSMLIDSEVQAATDRPAGARRSLKARCKKVGFDCHITARRALENYFTGNALAAIYGTGTAALGHYDPVTPGWPKTRNWEVAEKMSVDDLRGTDLGEFLFALKDKYKPGA